MILAHLLAERFSGPPITFASMHPGWVDTTALRTSLPTFYGAMGRFLRTPEQGADTVVWLTACEGVKGTPGQFWFDRRVAREYLFPWTRESAEARAQLLSLCEERGGMRLDERLGRAA